MPIPLCPFDDHDDCDEEDSLQAMWREEELKKLYRKQIEEQEKKIMNLEEEMGRLKEALVAQYHEAQGQKLASGGQSLRDVRAMSPVQVLLFLCMLKCN